MQISIRRAYDDPSEDDGYRVLVDRLWPRGVNKESLVLNEWCKDVAPSPELRRWFGHAPDKFDEFSAKYNEELQASGEAEKLIERASSHDDKLTLIYAAKDPQINHAIVLKEYLRCLK